MILYTKACDGRFNAGCTGVGFLYDHAVGVTKDEVKAAFFYRRGCDGGDPVGCYNLGIDYARGTGVARDQAKALVLFRKALEESDDGKLKAAIQQSIRELSAPHAAGE